MNSLTFIHRIRNSIKIQNGNSVMLGKNVGLSGCKVTLKGQNNTLTIGDRVRLRNMTIEIVGDNCRIEIGKNCVIGHGCYLSAKETDVHLIIGEDCMFSRNVNILTSDGHPVFHSNRRINPAQSIVIGGHVWLADNVTILKGVTVGSGSVIGIHSLLTKSVPEYSVAVGIPAKVVKTEIKWET